MTKYLNKAIFIFVFAAGVVAGVGGFNLWLAQNQRNQIGEVTKEAEETGLSLDEAGTTAMAFINNAIQEQNPGVTASLMNIAEASGVYKIHLQIENKEYDSFLSKDGKYLFSSAFNLSGEESGQSAGK